MYLPSFTWTPLLRRNGSSERFFRRSNVVRGTSPNFFRSDTRDTGILCASTGYNGMGFMDLVRENCAMRVSLDQSDMLASLSSGPSFVLVSGRATVIRSAMRRSPSSIVCNILFSLDVSSSGNASNSSAAVVKSCKTSWRVLALCSDSFCNASSRCCNNLDLTLASSSILSSLERAAIRSALVSSTAVLLKSSSAALLIFANGPDSTGF
mmetsp:Transcript_3825/g.7052  ORF Transcript_3825/g.7052 Transcript_3825/m.7052 type:complete len:209 (-) Transcript_3825:516-1142(-)